MALFSIKRERDERDRGVTANMRKVATDVGDDDDEKGIIIRNEIMSMWPLSTVDISQRQSSDAF